ncbi:MBL fold metallo-hydrolase [Candidatus Rariloculus sp.]|uniref:MBL fold metallo-hydrolase n=1 Tax=Candidatus Rariloculus sp. TaxID=3101265 RepID=UPI003D1177F8
MSTLRTVFLTLFSATLMLLGTGVTAQRELPELEIEPLTEHVYRYGGLTNGAFIVGSEGIAVVDGQVCGSNGTVWLKEELARRFDVPVKYTILSHDHEMHICGLEVFSDTARAVSHVNAKPHIIREGRRTVTPEITFDTTMRLDLGGIEVVLMYLGPTHTDNLIQVHVPSEGVLIAVDFVREGKSLAMPELRDADIANSIKALGILGRMENVDIVVPGHGGVTDQRAFLYFRDYLQALRERVLEQMVAGKGIEEILEIVTMEDFSDYGWFDLWVRSNVIGMWELLYHHREPTEGGGRYESEFPIGFAVGEVDKFSGP